MPPPEDDRSRLLREGEERGRARQAVEARLVGHDEAIKGEREARTRLEVKVDHVRESVDRLRDDFREQRTKENTLAKAAQAAVSRQVTKREFTLGVIAIIVTLLGTVALVVANHV